MPIQQMYISVCNFPSGAKPQTVEEPKLNYNKGECVHIFLCNNLALVLAMLVG
jgi:hypothetical protein